MSLETINVHTNASGDWETLLISGSYPDPNRVRLGGGLHSLSSLFV